jgi:hypothetical protein
VLHQLNRSLKRAYAEDGAEASDTAGKETHGRISVKDHPLAPF